MKNRFFRKMVCLGLSAVVGLSMTATPIFGDEQKELTEKAKDIVTVKTPYDISFEISLHKEMKQSLVISKEFEFENFGQDDAIVIINDLKYIFNDTENCESSNVPITSEIMEQSGKKLLFMEVFFSDNASIQKSIITDKRISEPIIISLEAEGGKNKSNFRFVGSANANSDVEWQDKEVKVQADFVVYKKSVYEEMLQNGMLIELPTEETTEISEVTTNGLDIISEYTESTSESTETTTEESTEATTTAVTTEVTTVAIQEEIVEDIPEANTEIDYYQMLDEALEALENDGGAGGGAVASGGAIDVESTTENTTFGNEGEQGGSGGGSILDNIIEIISEIEISETTEESTEESTEETTEGATEESTEETTEDATTEVVYDDELESDVDEATEKSSGSSSNRGADGSLDGSMIQTDAVVDEKTKDELQLDFENDAVGKKADEEQPEDAVDVVDVDVVDDEKSDDKDAIDVVDNIVDDVVDETIDETIDEEDVDVVVDDVIDETIDEEDVDVVDDVVDDVIDETIDEEDVDVVDDVIDDDNDVIEE